MAPRIPTITPKHTDVQPVRTRPVTIHASTVNKDALAHALIQCLRLFARHGQKIQLQRSISSPPACKAAAFLRVSENSAADQTAQPKPHSGGGEG